MVGNRINKLRKEKKITLKKLGEIISVTESTVSMYENNKRKPDLNTIIKIANYFDCSTDYLLRATSVKKQNCSHEHVVANMDTDIIERQCIICGCTEVMDRNEFFSYYEPLISYRRIKVT